MKTESKINRMDPIVEGMRLLRTPTPPYVVAITTKIRKAAESNEYIQSMKKLEKIVETYDGFLGMECVEEKKQDGLYYGVSAIYWQTISHLDSWRNDVRHINLKKTGKKIWYEEHNVRICQVIEHYGANLTQGNSKDLAYEQR